MKQQNSFIVTVTVPHSTFEHSTRTDSDRVAETNVQTATATRSDVFAHQGYLVLPDVQYRSSEKKPVAIVFAFFRVYDVNILTALLIKMSFMDH